MDKIIRIWNEQDFSELYEEEPKIISTSTYLVVHLVVQSETIKVKIPTNSTEEVYKFLLYKAIFFHYLDQRSSNPLCKTALVAFFQSSHGFRDWYQLWASGRSLSKSCSLRCVTYEGEESMKRYKPLAVLEEGPGFIKVLSRSRKDGKYYSVSILNSQETDQSHLKRLEQSFKCLQHPFLVQLVQSHRNSKFAYYVFEHFTYSLGEILKSKAIQLSKEQKVIYFIQILLAMVFLDHHPILKWGLSMEIVHLNFDGHIVISENVVRNGTSKESRGLFLKQLYDQLMGVQQRNQFNEQELLFQEFLAELSFGRKLALKQILNHSWIQRQSVQKILAKSSPNFSVPDLKGSPLPESREISKHEIDFYFENPYEQYPDNYKFQSLKIKRKTANETVLKKYLGFNQQPQRIQFQRLKKTNSSLSLNKKERRSNKIRNMANVHHRNSPYQAVLKKESNVNRRKPLQQ